VPYAGSEDPEVAAGAGLFAAAALGVIWVIWPVGTLVLGLLLFLTRGRRRLVTLPGANSATPQPAARGGGSVPPAGHGGGSVPLTGHGGGSVPAAGHGGSVPPTGGSANP
ncbi:MAG: hypothetical protein K2X74_22035, partial [Acetobacteraceae bacterium]|nr:hypothetical protein [Acetobacteraceae bacterium]